MESTYVSIKGNPLMQHVEIATRKIQDKEKLGIIAKQYGNNEDILASLNGIQNKDLIFKGNDIKILLNKNITEGVEDEFIKMSQRDTNGDGCVEQYENLERYIDNQKNNTAGPKIKEISEWGNKFGVLIADGTMTYADLYDQLGLQLNGLPHIYPRMDLNSPIPANTEFKIPEKDLPLRPILDSNGNPIPYLTKSAFGSEVCLHAPTDENGNYFATKTQIKEEFNKYKDSALKEYDTTDIQWGYTKDLKGLSSDEEKSPSTPSSATINKKGPFGW